MSSAKKMTLLKKRNPMHSRRLGRFSLKRRLPPIIPEEELTPEGSEYSEPSDDRAEERLEITDWSDSSILASGHRSVLSDKVLTMGDKVAVLCKEFDLSEDMPIPDIVQYISPKLCPDGLPSAGLAEQVDALFKSLVELAARADAQQPAAIRIQALTRRWLAANVLIEGFAAAIFLQARARRQLASKVVAKMRADRSAATRLQATARRWQASKVAAQVKAEAASKARATATSWEKVMAVATALVGTVGTMGSEGWAAVNTETLLKKYDQRLIIQLDQHKVAARQARQAAATRIQAHARRYLVSGAAAAAAAAATRKLSRMQKLTGGAESERKRLEVSRALEQIRRSEKTDLCFLIDATGSMSSQIDDVKKQIKQIVADVQRTNLALQMRVAIVGYRDALEGDGGNSCFDFTDSIDTFVSNVGQIGASGGGDHCEDVASGLRDVLGLTWTSPTRCLFFIADAPGHGTRYNGGCGDNHSNGDHGVPHAINQIKTMGVDMVHCKINETTQVMIDAMNEDVSDPEYITTVPMSDGKQLLAHATRTLRKSMQKTLTGTLGLTATATSVGTKEAKTDPDFLSMPADSIGPVGMPVGETLASQEPSWEELDASTALVYTDAKVDIAKLKPSRRQRVAVGGMFKQRKRQSSKGRQLVCAKHQVKVAPEPFAQGSVRYARWGRLNDGSAEEPWRAVVFKDFKSKDPRQHSIESYLVEMEVNAVAAALALEFNKVVEPPTNRQMRYVGASVATVKQPPTARVHGPKERHFFVEEALEGEFTRYSYNTGYWEEGTLDKWLLKFALWTHEVTNGYLMVADLQGVLTDDGYVLTDPVILCTDLERFGSTNLGDEMIERCKASAEAHLEKLACFIPTGAIMEEDEEEGWSDEDEE